MDLVNSLPTWVIAAVALGFAFILWPVTLLILATLLGGPLGFLLAVIIIVIAYKKMPEREAHP